MKCGKLYEEVYRIMWMHNQKTTCAHCALLTMLMGAVIGIILLVYPDCVYGAQTDWSNQHFAIPEYFRTRFYATGNLFPNIAMHLGGGQNMFHFAYYGLYSPVIWPAYLFPDVPMAVYIPIMHILLTLLSTYLCYFWMKQWFPASYACFLAAMYLTAAPIIFHSHHHIMFTSYFPFLFWALFSIPKALRNHSSIALILSLVCVLLTNFYFSVGAFLAVFLYAIFYICHTQNKYSVSSILRTMGILTFHFLCSLLIAGFFLLPTIFTLLHGRDPSQRTSLLEILLPGLHTEYFTYSPFSMGLHSICILALLGLIQIRKNSYRFLAISFIILMLFPLFLYGMNGTMYLDAKAFIPLLPIMLLVCGFFFQELSHGHIPHKRTLWLFCTGIAIHILWFQSTLYEHIALILDGVFMSIVFLYFIRKKAMSILLVSSLLMSITICLVVNLGDNYMKQADLENIYDKNISEIADTLAQTDNTFYRISNEAHAGNTVNCVWGPSYYRSSVYSSIHNRFLSDFFFTQTQSENSIRNKTMLVQSKNPIFGMLMGEKYILSQKELHRYGLTLRMKHGSYYVYENTLAFPIGYATPYVMTQAQYQDLEKPSQLEAILHNAIVPANDMPSTKTYTTQFPGDLKPVKLSYTATPVSSTQVTKIADGYYIHSSEAFSVTVTLHQPIENEMLLLQFRVNNQLGDGSTTDDVSITINGIRNRLTDPDWKYQNHNNTFHYHFSDGTPIQTLEIHFSAGDYILAESKAYTLPYTELKSASSHLDPWRLQNDTLGDDTMEGDITVRTDGWFVLSVPYDEGFEITVDDRKTDYIQTNIDCIGFPISKGNHHIRITYAAPGFALGKKISVLGIGLMLLWHIGSFWYRQKLSHTPLTKSEKCSIMKVQSEKDFHTIHI